MLPDNCLLLNFILGYIYRAQLAGYQGVNKGLTVNLGFVFTSPVFSCSFWALPSVTLKRWVTLLRDGCSTWERRQAEPKLYVADTLKESTPLWESRWGPTEDKVNFIHSLTLSCLEVWTGSRGLERGEIYAANYLWETVLKCLYSLQSSSVKVLLTVKVPGLKFF